MFRQHPRRRVAQGAPTYLYTDGARRRSVEPTAQAADPPRWIRSSRPRRRHRATTCEATYRPPPPRGSRARPPVSNRTGRGHGSRGSGGVGTRPRRRCRSLSFPRVFGRTDWGGFPWKVELRDLQIHFAFVISCRHRVRASWRAVRRCSGGALGDAAWPSCPQVAIRIWFAIVVPRPHLEPRAGRHHRRSSRRSGWHRARACAATDLPPSWR